MSIARRSRRKGPQASRVTARHLAERLHVYTQRGDWYDANCPAHPDTNPSFSFKDDPDGLVVLCRAGCTFEQIAAALRAKFPTETFIFANSKPNQKRRIVAVYPYHDEDGQLLYEAVRFEPKAFQFRRPDGHGGYHYNLQGVRRVLYGLPELKGESFAFVTEGEKDADRLRARGWPVTTNPGGAGKWTDEYTAQLGAQGVDYVIVLPDNDHAGRTHAWQVARSCLRGEIKVAILPLPGLPEKGDVSDWLEQGHSLEELTDLVADTEPLTELPSDESEEEETIAPTGGALADRLVSLAHAAGIQLFHTPKSEPFAVIPVKDHDEVHSLSGEAFRSWLSRLAWTQEGKAAKADVLASTIQTLAAHARFDGPEEPVHLRAAWHERAVYYDLVDPSWRVVKVTPTGWEVLTQSPIRFVRHAGMAAQAVPERGGRLDNLWSFINIPEAHHRRLLEAWLVAALIPDIPRPALVLYGDQGAGKTTTARILGSLIDPHSAPLVRARDEAEFVQALAHHYVAILDNLSYLPEWLSNLLSRAITGEGFTKRRLYSDDDDVTYSFRRVIVLTGINLVVTKPDLLDRALIIGTERVADRQRVEDRALTEGVQATSPTLFGALLDLLVGAMAAYPQAILRDPPRMADFARWGAAASLGTGQPADRFAQDYARNVAQQNEQAIGESFVGTLVVGFMQNKSKWQGTAEELLGYLQSMAEAMHITKRDLPGSPQLLGRRLREIRPNLAAIGYRVSFSEHHHPRTITLIRERRT